LPSALSTATLFSPVGGLGLMATVRSAAGYSAAPMVARIGPKWIRPRLGQWKAQSLVSPSILPCHHGCWLPLPISFALHQNYPNPFNPTTTIRYELPKASIVTLSVFDILGREVSVLVNERRDAGSHEVNFCARNLASGVYLCRMQAGDFVQLRKLLLVQ
jgi:hypothetical protein